MKSCRQGSSGSAQGEIIKHRSQRNKPFKLYHLCKKLINLSSAEERTAESNLHTGKLYQVFKDKKDQFTSQNNMIQKNFVIIHHSLQSFKLVDQLS